MRHVGEDDQQVISQIKIVAQNLQIHNQIRSRLINITIKTLYTYLKDYKLQHKQKLNSSLAHRAHLSNNYLTSIQHGSRTKPGGPRDNSISII